MMKTKFLSPKRWLAAPVLAMAAACVLFAQPVLAQTRAALVQSVDEPGRNPYQESQGVTCSATVCSFSFAPVPAGKRLVLTHVNGYTDTVAGSLPTGLISSGFGGSAAYATLVFTGVRGQTFAAATRIFMNHNVLAYFGPGEPLNASYSFVMGSGNSFFSGATLMLTGYFVNVP